MENNEQCEGCKSPDLSASSVEIPENFMVGRLGADKIRAAFASGEHSATINALPSSGGTPNFTLADTEAATVLALGGSTTRFPSGAVMSIEGDDWGIKTKVKFKYRFDDDDDNKGGLDLGKFVHPHPRRSIFEGPGGVRKDPTIFNPTPPSTGEDRPPVSNPLPFVDPGQDVIDQLWEDYARRREHPLFPGKFKGGRDEGWAPFFPFQPPFPVLRPKAGVAGPWPLGGGVSGGMWGGGMLGDPDAGGASGGIWIKLGDIRIWVGASATGPDERGRMGGGGEIGGSILWD